MDRYHSVHTQTIVNASRLFTTSSFSKILEFVWAIGMYCFEMNSSARIDEDAKVNRILRADFESMIVFILEKT